MAHLQSQFIRFDVAIKLKYYGESAELREKRDRVLTRLQNNLGQRFRTFDQGSYAMKTGIKPVDLDYDIDVGVALDLSGQPDPVAVKTRVYNALQDHTARVEFRKSCITVYYQQGGEPKFHVDVAVYWAHQNGLYLAVGKQYAAASERTWQQAAPERLVEIFNTKFTGDDGEQFRRVIRMLKRWSAEQFPSQGAAAPRGIALTACALQWFGPISQRKPNIYGTTTTEYNDLAALKGVVDFMLASFAYRLSATLPVPPGSDLFSRMTDQQMGEFKDRLRRLQGALQTAGTQGESGACATLRNVLGNSFPAI